MRGKSYKAFYGFIKLWGVELERRKLKVTIWITLLEICVLLWKGVVDALESDSKNF